MKVYRNRELMSLKGPNEWFIGDVIVDPLYQNVKTVTKGATALVIFPVFSKVITPLVSTVGYIRALY